MKSFLFRKPRIDWNLVVFVFSKVLMDENFVACVIINKSAISRAIPVDCALFNGNNSKVVGSFWKNTNKSKIPPRTIHV